MNDFSYLTFTPTPLPGFTHEMQLVDNLLSFVSWEIPLSSHGTTLTFMVCTFLVKCKMVRRIDRSIASHRIAYGNVCSRFFKCLRRISLILLFIRHRMWKLAKLNLKIEWTLIHKSVIRRRKRHCSIGDQIIESTVIRKLATHNST